jgi:uncharacterized protein (TIGR02246 family)
MTSRNQSVVRSDFADLAEAWTQAWNTHDMQATRRLFAPDADFVTVGGLWLRGVAEVLRHHEAIHRGHLRDSAWTTHGIRARFIREDLAVVHVEWSLTGERGTDDELRPPRSGVFTWIVDCARARPVVVAAHNTNHRSDVGPRLTQEDLR